MQRQLVFFDMSMHHLHRQSHNFDNGAFLQNYTMILKGVDGNHDDMHVFSACHLFWGLTQHMLFILDLQDAAPTDAPACCPIWCGCLNMAEHVLLCCGRCAVVRRAMLPAKI